MSYSIQYFMWSYQHLYRISANSAAGFLFRLLDERLQPEVFLVGMLMRNRSDRYPLCVEPEEGEIPPSLFHDLKERMERLEAKDFESKIIHSHPIAEENRGVRVFRNAYANAVQETLNEAFSADDLRFFASFPQIVEDFLVTVVLQVQRSAYDSHYALKQNICQERFRVPVSLLNATVETFLRECSRALKVDVPGVALDVVGRKTEELVRQAGRLLMYNLEARIGDFEGQRTVFDALCNVASLRYEGAEGVGRLLISKPDHPSIEVAVRFGSPVGYRDARATRKLLELATDDLALLGTTLSAYGLGRMENRYDESREDLFEVAFLRHHTWELQHAGHTLMHVRYGQPMLKAEPLSEDRFKMDVQRVLGMEDVEVNLLWEITAEARCQSHGTLLIISSHAEEEANRLAGQSTGIEPVILDRQLVASLTAIDGALLLDPSGTCYSIGVILDGLATAGGTPARGARYNSAVRYVHTATQQFGHRCIAVVVSEDATVDIIPTLRPPIHRSQIEAALNILRELVGDSEPSRYRFSRATAWLDKHEFYLNKATCEEANLLISHIEAHFDQRDPHRVKIIRRLYEPHPGLDDSYFFDE